MSLEQAINDHAAALRELADAIRTAGTGAAVTEAAPAKASSETEPKQEASEGPVYWADSETGEYGKVETEAEYKKLKKAQPGVFKIPESQYDERCAAAKKKEAENKAAAADKAEKAKADKPADKAEKAKADKPKAKAKPAVEEDDGDEVTVTKEDLIATFQKFLSKDLDAETRDERAAFVKPILKHFGAAKVSELDSQHYASAVKLVELKLAGHDIDTSDEDFDPVAIIAELSGADDDDSLV